MTKVFVGLSGGVDSAVSAALLKAQGHQVTGCFIKIWQPEFIECTWREDRLDAMRVAASLDIPFREVDFSDEYKKEVVDRMVDDYRRGITPNPDVLCNTHIKFGHFLSWARDQGAEYLATGHYARVQNDDFPKLLRGFDSNKDQSYFLWQLGTEELKHTLFPIGEMKKKDVRAYAQKRNLPNAEKPDSQGLCFVGDVSIEEFLGRFLPLNEGDVLNLVGETVGKHAGAALYTIGQRHGFTRNNTPEEGAHYVVAVDVEKNTITVSHDRSQAGKKKFYLRDCLWNSETRDFPFQADVQTRYREVPIEAVLEKEGERVFVTLSEPYVVSPGQSLVVYQGDTCLGGGVIV